MSVLDVDFGARAKQLLHAAVEERALRLADWAQFFETYTYSGVELIVMRSRSVVNTSDGVVTPYQAGARPDGVNPPVDETAIVEPDARRRAERVADVEVARESRAAGGEKRRSVRRNVERVDGE